MPLIIEGIKIFLCFEKLICHMFFKRLFVLMNSLCNTPSIRLRPVFGIALVLVLFLSGCKTTKKKEDISGLGMLYQNMTAHYNGYFNATEIMKETEFTLSQEYKDNFNQILPVFEYTAVEDPKSVAANLDEAIKKASVVISLHRPSKWTDDCYLLIGQAQYLKQDYESAQKTLEYMVNNFDETGKSKAKSRKKPSKAKSQAERQKQIKEKNKEIEARKKEQALDRKEKTKEIKSSKKERAKSRKAQQRERDKANKARKKARDKANKERRKNRKKGKKKKYVKPTPSTKTNDTNKDKSETKVEDEKETTVKSDKTEKIKDDPKDRKKKDIEEEDEDEKKSNKKKKEKEEKTKDGAMAHNPARPYGVLWLAKTYAERDFITQADRLFRQMSKAEGSDKKLMEDLYPSMADFYIYTENYAEAIPALEHAIETTSQKSLKARYSYIIGQLKMILNSPREAVAYFDQAASWSRDYEMEFNARMSSKLASMSSGSGSESKIAGELEKLLKDDKNAEFKDQIYFQIAKVYLEADNDRQAEEYLILALENTSTNPAQKTEIHYALGDIYYEKDKFDLAYDNYTLALSSMPKTDSRYRKLENSTINLKGIAAYLKTLNLQDSLIMLSGLSDEELKDRAKLVMQERSDKLEAAKDKLNAATGKTIPSNLASPTQIASSNNLESKFFAYNDKDLKKGEREFAKLWGSRPMVDDWRRNEAGEVSSIVDYNDVEITIPKEPTSNEVDDIFSDLPRSDEQQSSAKEKIAEALYNLGMEYRNKLERLDLSSEAFQRFVTDFPEDARLAEAYYFLYLNARDQKDMNTAQQYASLLQDKFPDTKYALIANDPTYIDELLNDKNSVEVMYDATYTAFLNGDYKRTYDAFDIAKNKFGTENSYASKFALLQAMSVGKLQGKEQYVESLRTVVAQYPNTTEQIRAREIIRFLSGDELAFDRNWDEELIVTSYKAEFDKLHYIIIALYNEDVVPVDAAKISINDYNNLFHKLDKFSIRSFIINRDTKDSAILIRKFDGKEDAMKYHKEVSGRMTEFLPKDVDCEIFAISQFNYREMIKAGGLESYKSFFRDNYLR